MKNHTVTDSPYGPLTLVAEDGVLCGLYMQDQRHRPPEENFGARDDDLFAEAGEQLDAYFAGELTEFTVELRLDGTPFQRSVWEQLCLIPYGQTRSYGELADALGSPQASQHRWVYIDRGAEDGVKPGMVFRHYEHEDDCPGGGGDGGGLGRGHLGVRRTEPARRLVDRSPEFR